jgi:L-alanine-DL-glutamate epimerase-like enolase superfamily enzyme
VVVLLPPPAPNSYQIPLELPIKPSPESHLHSVVADPQHRWLGPEKGVIALATAAVANAVWDMMAKFHNKPLWKLIVDFTPEE